jgi:hypothetical protein
MEERFSVESFVVGRSRAIEAPGPIASPSSKADIP